MKAFAHISYAAKTDVGRKRKNNEDAFGVFPDSGVFCVADGMGGGDDGEIASAAVIKSVGSFALAYKPPPNVGYAADDIASGIAMAVEESSAWICSRATERKLKGCGSTFVGICFDATAPSEALALHAGDSRLYRIRGSSIKQITKDHSAAELIGAKDESAVNPCFRGVILRAVGIHPTVDVERTPLSLKEGDRIVICSDGLSKMVDDRKIAAIVHGEAAPEAAADALIAAANDAGGSDNVTAVVIFVGKLPLAMPAVSMPLPEAPTDPGENDDEADTTNTGSGDGFAPEPDTADDPRTLDTATVKPQSRGRALRVAAAAFALVLAVSITAFTCAVLVRRARARDAAGEAERQRNVQELSKANSSAVAEERSRREENATARADARASKTAEPDRETELVREGEKEAPSCANEPQSDAGDEKTWVSQVLPVLVQSCAPTNSEAFVATVRRFPVKGGVETLQMRFRPLCDEKLPIARRQAIAAVVTADMQDISRELRRYSERRIEHIDAALSEHATRAEFKKKLVSEREGLAAFMAATEGFGELDAASVEAQKMCADVMLGVAKWFRPVD